MAGGFTHSDVYNMPVYLRRFYFNLLIEQKNEENEEIKKSQSKSKTTNNPKFKR